MRLELLAAAGKAGGVLTRSEALAFATVHVLEDAVRAGLLVQVLHNTYALSAGVHDREVWQLAVCKYRPDGALSHLDALSRWGLPAPLLPAPDGMQHPIYLTTGPGRLTRSPAIRQHRRRDFASQPTFVHPHHPGLVLVDRSQAIVESWPLLHEVDRRAPIIVGLRDRHVSAIMLQMALARNPKTAGAADMRQIIELVAAGNHSELELWGHANVFNHPALARAEPQFTVRCARRKFVLDRYFRDEMLDVELDGAAYHGQPGQRERDLRRDTTLARIGIQTLRFSHPRLHSEPLEVIAEIRATLQIRRRQFGIPD